MFEKGYGVKDILFTGAKANVDTIPRDQFQRGLIKIGFEPSIGVEKFMDLLADKKDIKMVNLKAVKDKMKKNQIKKPDQANLCLEKMPQKVRIVLDNIQKYLVDRSI